LLLNAVTEHVFKVAAGDKCTNNKDGEPELTFSDEISGYSDYDTTEYFVLCA